MPGPVIVLKSDEAEPSHLDSTWAAKVSPPGEQHQCTLLLRIARAQMAELGLA